jgi:aspartate 1-decarboxylase
MTALKTFVGAKIHGLRITDKSLNYRGSATIPGSLMDAAGIDPYERVYLVNKSNGNRWDTYALRGPEGEFTLNGAAARQGEIGDEILLWTFRQEPAFTGASVVFVNPDNTLDRIDRYENP